MTTVTAPEPTQNPKTTWKEVFTSGDDVVGLNTIHPQVAKLLQVTTNEELSATAQKEMMGNITALKLNSIMFKSTFGEMTILHHNTKVGGDLLCPDAEYFGLFGQGKVAMPFKFKPTSILKVNEVDSPSWDTIQAIKTPDDLTAARDATPNLRHFTSAIAIPPYLTQALMSLQGPSVADIFMEVLRVLALFDTEKEESVPQTSETNKDILSYLWGVHNDLIESVPTSPHVSSTITKLVKEIHSKSLHTTPTPSATVDLTDPTRDRYFDQMNARLGTLVSNSIMSQAASSAATKKKFETRLNPLFRNLILTGSAPDGDSIPSEPDPESRTFFEQKNASEAKSFLQHKLIVEKSLPIYIPSGLVTAIWSGCVFWDRLDSPSNFSFFLVPAQSASMVSDTADTIALSLKTSDGRGGIDSDDIRRLTKQKVYIPTTINKIKHHLNHGIHILAIVFGPLCFKVAQLRQFQRHIQTNIATYIDLARQDSLFPAKVLYIIDLRVQNFFKACQQGKFSPECLDFSMMFHDIVQNRSFNSRLPDCILPKKRKYEDDRHGGGRKSPHQGKGGKEAKGAWIKNPKIISEWKIKPEESFGLLFHQKRDHIPKRNGTQLCAGFHIKGWCYANCPYDHDTIERNTPIFTKMNTFCQRCRNSGF